MFCKRTEGIQKNEEYLGSDEKELLLQETIDGLNAKIFQIQSDHEKELEMIMVNCFLFEITLTYNIIQARKKNRSTRDFNSKGVNNH